MPVPFNKAIYLSVAQKAASTQKCCCAIPTPKPTCIDISRSANAAAAVELANLFHTITQYQVGSTSISDGGDDLYDTANKWTVDGKLLKYTDNGEFGEVSGQLYSMDIVAGGLSVVLFDDYAFDTLQYGPGNDMGADESGEKSIHEFEFLNWHVHIEVILDPTADYQFVPNIGPNDSPNHVVMILVDRSEGVVIKPTSASTGSQNINLSGISNSRIIFLHGAIDDLDNETFKANSPIFRTIATQIIGLH